MPLELKFDIDVNDWYPFLGTATVAITRWAEVQGKMQKDEYGYYYDLNITGDPHADIKRHRVLRPATLHLGATKALTEAYQYRPGWNRSLDELFMVITRPPLEFRKSAMSLLTLDFLVQIALFRGEVLFP